MFATVQQSFEKAVCFREALFKKPPVYNDHFFLGPWGGRLRQVLLYMYYAIHLIYRYKPSFPRGDDESDANSCWYTNTGLLRLLTDLGNMPKNHCTQCIKAHNRRGICTSERLALRRRREHGPPCHGSQSPVQHRSGLCCACACVSTRCRARPRRRPSRRLELAAHCKKLHQSPMSTDPVASAHSLGSTLPHP